MPNDRSNPVIAFRDGLAKLPTHMVERTTAEHNGIGRSPGRSLGQIFSAMDRAFAEAEYASSAYGQPVKEAVPTPNLMQVWRGEAATMGGSGPVIRTNKSGCGCGGKSKGTPLPSEMQARIRQRLDELGADIR
ncbi:MAG: hypothetical protein H6839_08625 [Planctomycetes bacterium]|nr:hypothetical protein [Planctomycetota bacterium]